MKRLKTVRQRDAAIVVAAVAAAALLAANVLLPGHSAEGGFDTRDATPTHTSTMPPIDLPTPAPEGSDLTPAPSSPTPPLRIPPISAPQPSCGDTESGVANADLGVAFCLPTGWGDIARRASVSDLAFSTGIIVAGPMWSTPANDSPVASGSLSPGAIRVRIEYVSSYLALQGCTPTTTSTSPVVGFATFCEDRYDILPNGEGVASPTGKLTGWKFLIPVSGRAYRGFSWEGGSIYVKVVFPSEEAAEAIPEVIALLRKLIVRP